MRKKIIGILLILVAIIIFSCRIYTSISMDRNMKGYLTRASEANSIELASKELRIAVTYLEKHNMTSGYTSILYTTPNEDVGFWYTNLKQSLDELETLNSTSALEKSNVLLKLRESLLSGKGNVIVPKGLSVFPNNLLWTILMWFSVIGGFIGFTLLIPKSQLTKK